ncbi:MAG: MBL fold metallo-hydrolase [Acidobacteriia bacterium]|nr:MBL fold metallo-hydrolase [Terriglobia bacterium]
MSTKRQKHCAKGLTVLFLFAWYGFAQAPRKETSKTQIVLLGTGTPAPDPEHSGPSTAIVVNGTPYLVDFGTGVVRQAAAARKKGVQGLEPVNLRIAFLTHLHSDHTLGFPDLILTPWVVGRKEPLEVYGPPGTSAMAEHILKAYGEDINIRTGVKIGTGDMEHSNSAGYKVNVHEILPGVVFKDQNVTVTAFAVHHGKWAHAYGYRFETPDRTIVISGDTAPDVAILDNCHRCDVLIHEVYTQASFDMVSPEWKQYRLAYHTSSKELAEMATKAKPGLLILDHRANPGCGQMRTQECVQAGSEEQLLKEVRQGYSGKVVAGHDLDVY